MSDSEARLDLVLNGGVLLGVINNDGADVPCEAWYTPGKPHSFSLLFEAPPPFAIDSEGLCVLDFAAMEAGRLAGVLMRYEDELRKRAARSN